MSGSRVMRRSGAGWEGVEPRAYKEVAGGHRGVVRHLLAGGRAGEGAGAGGAASAGGEPAPFEVRAFRVEPGGFTSREHHAHPHAVVVLEGRGSVRLGEGGDERRVELAPGDALWIAPWDAHQLRADADAPLAFLCVVPTERDRPRPLGAGDGDGAEPSPGPAAGGAP